MAVIFQCDPVVPLETPKGYGEAHFLIDCGREHHLQWVVFLAETGESWVFDNPDVRLAANMTTGRPARAYKWRPFWKKKK